MAGDEYFWNQNSSATWDMGRFLVHTDANIKEQFQSLDQIAIDKLLSYPCLFMYEFTHTSRDGIKALKSEARVGRLLSIEKGENEVKFAFNFVFKFRAIDSQELSENWKILGIDMSRGENYRSHWAVKNVDLYAVLTSAGLMQVLKSAAPPTKRPTIVQSIREIDEMSGRWFTRPKLIDAPEVVEELREISQTAPKPTGEKPKVFVVHGRDDGRKNEVARWLAKVGMDDIVLHEHPNLGRSILTKFRDLAKDTSFAVVVATPDDVGGLVGETQAARARQNVILELGFFIGVLGPERTALLRCDPKLEIPSDYSGILVIDYDARGAWKVELAREFRALGISFDASALI